MENVEDNLFKKEVNQLFAGLLGQEVAEHSSWEKLKCALPMFYPSPLCRGKPSARADVGIALGIITRCNSNEIHLLAVINGINKIKPLDPLT